MTDKENLKRSSPSKLDSPSAEDYAKERPTDSKDVSNHESDVMPRELKTLTDLPGVGEKTAAKLRLLGYTLYGIATGRADEIAAEMGVTFLVAKNWVMVAQEAVLAKMSMQSAEEYDKSKKQVQVFFKTGSPSLNNLLGGGVCTGATTGASGRFSTGKSQIGFDIIVDALGDKSYEKCFGGKPLEVAFIETEPNTFNLDRLKQIAAGRKLSCDWSKLWIIAADQIPNAKAQFLEYKVVQRGIEKLGKNIHLIVVDSFTAKFRPGYSRREMLPVRTREFTEHFLLMEFLAAKYNIAWYLTCQVIGAPDPGQQLGIKMKTGDSFYPVGGEFLLHSVNTWLGIQQIKTDLYEGVLYDSSYLPRGKAIFCLGKDGLKDGFLEAKPKPGAKATTVSEEE